MDLTPAQLQTLRAHILANTDPIVVAARHVNVRADNTITSFYNEASATLAWPSSVSGNLLFETMDVTKFDALTAGKRAAWDLMLRYSPIDLTRQRFRTAVLDVWGVVDGAAMLTALRVTASRFEVVFGGPLRSTGVAPNAVQAINRTVVGSADVADISRALNLQS